MTVFVAAGCAYALVAPLLVLMTGAALAVDSCGDAPSSPASPSATVFDEQQLANAELIVDATRGFPATAASPRAAVIAVAVAAQETSLRNLPRGDRDSVGLFQQRPSQGWGTSQQLQRPRFATRRFLEALVQIPGWSVRPLTDVASDVQRPDESLEGAYARWELTAEALVEQSWPEAGECDGGSVGPGEVRYPVAPNLAWSDQRNWGGSGEHWDSWHTGTDFSLPCGTPVFASTDGRVEVVPGPDWFGAALVEVHTRPGGLTTWYAHLQTIEVSDGEQVLAGHKIGAVGDLGNATGCHLHFEVHLRDGGIYDADNVDPSAWLSSHASGLSTETPS